MAKKSDSGLPPITASGVDSQPRLRLTGSVRRDINGLIDVDCKKGVYYRMTMDNRLHSPFLALPAEVRNEIYEYCLSGEDYQVTSEAQIIKVVNKNRETKFYLSLLQVSRQLYTETAVLPFQLSTFHADGPKTLSKWAAGLPAASRKSISSIHLTTNISWHRAESYKNDKLPTWWSNPKNFPEFPALRQVSIFTVVPGCYCYKDDARRKSLLDFLGESELALKVLIEAEIADTKVSFKREIAYEPLGLDPTDDL